MFRPDHKYHAAKIIAESPEGENSPCRLVQLLVARENGIPYSHGPLERAYEIYSNEPQSKILMEALLMAPDTAVEKIVTTMRCKKEMVEAYIEFFFDTSFLEDGFAVGNYISKIEHEGERLTKKMAYQHGFYYMASSFCGGELKISHLDVMKRLQGGCYRMFEAGAGCTLTSDSAKESRAWGTLLKSVNEYLAKADTGDSQQDFLAQFRVLFKTDGELPEIGSIEGEVFRG